MNHPMTLFGKKLIEDELTHLIKVEREAIKTALAEARELGDLKENAEYHAAKEKQSHVEGRIAELQGKLAKAQAIDVSKISNDKIVFGATVTLFDHQKNISITVQIVGEDEATGSNKKISYNSPLGRALIGKEMGDEVVVKAPKGDMHFEVEDFTYEDSV
jgi:transcription elongation factor GreA